MSYKSSSKQKSDSESTQRKFLWVGVVVAALIFIFVAVSVWQQTSFPFSFSGGEKEALVLLNNSKDAEYQLKFTGNEPVALQRVVIQLESNQLNLHVDVDQVTAIVGDQEISLDDSGYVPEGTQILLQPDEVFTVRVAYSGASIGGHYVYGFRLGYEAEGVYNENTLNIKDKEFIVVVE